MTILRSIAVCALLASSVEAATVKRTHFQVQIPQSLYVEGGYRHNDAMFGIPPYGTSIEARVIYANDLLCSGHTGLSEEGYYPSSENLDGSPFILMVDRGDCFFVTKVRNAEFLGAAAVLVADNKCICGDDACEPDEGSDLPCQDAHPIMADDGSAADIFIPSFLLPKPEADNIKDALMANEHVEAQMSFSVPNPDDRVEYELWMTPEEPVSRNFLSNFWEAAELLGSDAKFTPHFFLWDGVSISCYNNSTYADAACRNHCTNNGRYCIFLPEDDLQEMQLWLYGIQGKDLVEEALRRMCVWEQYGQDGVGKEWWDYVEAFFTRCDNDSGQFASDSCIQGAMDAAGVDFDIVNTCMENSGGLEGDVENTMLKASLDAIKEDVVYWNPSVFVNGQLLQGTLNTATVFNAICAGFVSETAPAICQACALCPDVEQCVQQGGTCSSPGFSQVLGASREANGDTVSVQTLVGAMVGVTVGLCLIFGILAWILYKKQQRQMRREMEGLMKTQSAPAPRGSSRFSMSSSAKENPLDETSNMDVSERSINVEEAGTSHHMEEDHEDSFVSTTSELC